MNNYPQVFVRVVINGKDNKILILKQSNNSDLWELPGGEVIKFESVRNSAERTVYNVSSLIIQTLSNKYYVNTLTENNAISLGVDAKLLLGTVDLKNQYTDFKWISLEEIYKYKLTDESRTHLINYITDVEALNKLEEPKIKPVVIVARGLIKNNKDKFLFLQRSRTNSYPITWELPGGKLNILEKIEDSIVREIFEETGLVTEVTKTVSYINSTIQISGRFKGYTYINIVSEAIVTAGDIILTDKHQKYGWYTKSDIFNLELAPYMKIQLTELFRRKDKTSKM